MGSRQVIYYVAQSLDGYIARPDGNIDWLFDGVECGYEDFYAGIDTLLIGRVTYELVMSWDVEWPYPGKRVVIGGKCSTEPGSDPEGVEWTEDMVAWLREELKRPGDNIWLVGGGGLARAMFDEDLVDQLQLFVHPVYLGDGIPAVPPPFRESWWRLEKSQRWDRDLLQLVYQRVRK